MSDGTFGAEIEQILDTVGWPIPGSTVYSPPFLAEWGEAAWTARDEAERELRAQVIRARKLLPLLMPHGAIPAP